MLRWGIFAQRVRKNYLFCHAALRPAQWVPVDMDNRGLTRVLSPRAVRRLDHLHNRAMIARRRRWLWVRGFLGDLAVGVGVAVLIPVLLSGWM